MSLGEELAARAESGWQAMPAERRAVYTRAAEALAASGIAQRALQVGDPALDFELPDATGRPVRLSDLLFRGPVILSFYRGAWCPFCNMELRALQQALGEIKAAGATLVAVSPNSPDTSIGLVERLGLDYPVLSDHNNVVARRFHLVYEMLPEQVAMYRADGRDVGAMNGTEVWELPVPATYVIDRDGTIKYGFVDLNHRRRAEPAEVVAVAARLATKEG
ncbi:MAG TPA: peroxiredoxin-like family protein [Acidimicrobiia bacterium]|nr:peroxiredoxin-like family protein [Acidimicrobiia bacterium]